jgi:hypothetical protein
MTEYRVCHIAKIPFGRESTVLHIQRKPKQGLWGEVRGLTLCGFKAGRPMTIFKPSEATCRECLRRAGIR